MKNLVSSLIALGVLTGSLSGQILIPNGDFEAANDALTWIRVDGGGDAPPVTFATGGNPNGYGTVTPVGGWGILVSPITAGGVGGGIPIADLGLTAGGPVTFTYDSINLTGPGPVGGFKWEAWGGNTLRGNTGDVFPNLIGDGSTWETYTYDWTLPAGTDKLIFVALWAGGGNTNTVGFDNVGVIPEPATYAMLAGGFALALVILRRRR